MKPLLRRLTETFEVEAKLPAPEWTLLDNGYWEREVAPRRHELRADALRSATGLSLSYARRVLAGWHVPHKKHWRTVQSLLVRKWVQDAVEG